MKIKYLLAAVMAFSALAISGQDARRIVVSGLITDALTGETLIGAGAVSGKEGTVSNSFGFYSLTLPSGAESISFSYVGYEGTTVRLAARDTVLNVKLFPGSSLQEAVVTAQAETGIESTKMSALEVPLSFIKNAPALFGEADVLKSLQYLPGVQGGTEGFSGLYVRGGGPDENLLLLDGIPVYNAEHMLGIFSIFQTEAVKKVTLYKGAFPARYGGRVSSIIDVRTKDGNMYETHGNFGVSMISDKLHVEGPIWKGRTSYSLSARGMHTILIYPFLKLAGLDANYYFYDVDAKFTHRFSDRDRLYLNLYSGADNLHYKNKDEFSDIADGKTVDTQKLGIKWGNTVAALRWNHVLSGKLFSNTTAAFSRYNMKMNSAFRSDEIMDNGESGSYKSRYAFDYNSGMSDVVVKTDFDWSPVSSHRIKFGAEYTFHTFVPETMTSMAQEIEDGNVQVDTTYNMKSNNRQTGHEAGLYIEDDMDFGSRFVLNPGLRVSLFNTQGKNYFSVEPRISARWKVTGDWSVKAAWSRMSQFIHLLSSSQISLPVDLWVPITKNIRPETSDQYSLGVYYTGIPGWEFSLESYYKDIRNALEYKEGVAFMFDSEGWENKVETGSGRAMGLELFIEKTTGRTTGWLGYTLAKSDRVFPTINRGQRFPYKYDRRHTVNLVVNHRFSDRYDLSATWTYATGGTTTLPERRIVMTTPNGFPLKYADLVSSRNNFRLPASHTLNLGFNIHNKHRRGEGIWNISVYNVYNRKNPMLILKDYRTVMRKVDDGNGGHEWKEVMEPCLKKVTLLPFFPSIGYTRTF